MKTKGKVKEEFLKCAQRLAEREVIRNVSQLSPLCGGVIHQPKRPMNSIKVIHGK